MDECPLEIPQCKRNLMNSNKTFQTKQCPLNKKTPCPLVPPACPLLTQEDNVCGLSKLQNPKAPVSVKECPGKSPCILAPAGCPISSSNNEGTNMSQKPFPENMPLCSSNGCFSAVAQNKRKTINTEGIIKNKSTSNLENSQELPNEKNKTDGLNKRPVNSNKCPVSSSRRPLPCSECLLKELSSNGKGDGGKRKPCPFLRIADVCGSLCKCEDVPDVDAGPRCPFLPKPCPCCTAPRCPLSKQPECPLKPKPSCAASPSPPCCSCGKNFLGEKSPSPICPPPYNPPRCLCGGCPGGSPCPLTAPNCVCGSCPLLFPCCPMKPKTCLCGMCPIAKIICGSVPACPLSPSSPTAPSSSPCPLREGPPCPLLNKTICPPIPPPCSFNKYELQPVQPKTTFHVPICPEYKPPCQKHLVNKERNDLICPFSPHPCPLGPTCPFPIRNNQVSIGEALTTKRDESEAMVSANSSYEGCPASAGCGKLPSPECPAAEVLYPAKYKKKIKPKKEPCPLKECMKIPECPFSRAMPNVDCPMKGESDCPLSKEPDCPLVELASKCPITSNCPGLLTSPCPLESKRATETESNLKTKEPIGCPLSALPDCLKGGFKDKASCPLLPINDCPLAPKPACPLSPAPGCPLTEFSPVSDCPMACPLASSKCPLTSSICPLASDGGMKHDNKEKSDNELDKVLLDGTISKCIKKEANNGRTTECPFTDFAPKQTCVLAPPPCPLTPKPKCPLAKKPDPCPLSLTKPYCPVEYPSCSRFPGGRCPMGKLNICDCEYPVSPCLLPLQQDDFIAPPQYCMKQNCCMGLGLPPAIENPNDTNYSGTNSVDGYYYQFMDTKPGREETKHFVQIMTEPPQLITSLLGVRKDRVHNNWSIIKSGEGFKKCKTIAKKLELLGPIGNISEQYTSEDCVLDEEAFALSEIRKKRERDRKEVENLRRSLRIGNK